MYLRKNDNSNFTMKNDIIDSERTLDISEISEIERIIGIKLPKEYSEFLLKFNGGKPIRNCFVLDSEDYKEVSHFYSERFSIYSGDLIKSINKYTDQIPSHYLPVAESPNGDVFCISLKKIDFGSVYIWDHEMANYDGKPWEENMLKLAETLSIFLESLVNDIDT